jgi:hypothetical protein
MDSKLSLMWLPNLCYILYHLQTVSVWFMLMDSNPLWIVDMEFLSKALDILNKYLASLLYCAS